MALARYLFAFALVLVALPARAQPFPGAPEGASTATVSAAFGQGVTVRAQKPESFTLNVRLRGQVQGFAETKAEDRTTGERPRPDLGFMVRRLRLILQGNVFDRDLRYGVQLGFSPRDQEIDLLVPVLDAQLVWTKHRDLVVRVGQMKVPFNRERMISSAFLGMVDRSNVNFELNLDRDIGIMLQSRDLFGLGGRLRYNLGVFGGDGRNRTTPNTGLLYVARVEVAPFGNFDDYAEVDVNHSPKPKLALGFATAYSDATPRARATIGETFTAGTADYRHGAADLIFKLRGLSVQSEVLFRKASQTELSRIDGSGARVVEHPRSAWGYMVQAGLLLGDHWEPSVRYGEVRPFDSSNPKLPRDREIGGGLGYYIQQHDLKVQLDYFRLLTDADPTGSYVFARDRVRLQTQFFF